MRNSHITAGIFFIAICMGIGLLLAITSRRPPDAATLAQGAATIPEDQLIAEYAEGPEAAAMSDLGALEDETPEATAPRLPSFADHEVGIQPSSTPPKLEGSPYWSYRTRIRDGYAAGPNFGSSGTLVQWGCGTSCRAGVLIERATGQIFDLPLGGEDNPYLSFSYRQGSELLLATWEAQDDCVFEAFAWNGAEFVPYPEFPQRVRGRCPMPDEGA